MVRRIFFFIFLDFQIVYTTKISCAVSISEMSEKPGFFLFFLAPPSRSAALKKSFTPVYKY
jgi:hypothetical protein